MIELIGFALSDCVVDVAPDNAKYLRAVHRTALELAVPNQFGAEIGGFWLMAEQINQLRRLCEFYPAPEAEVVRSVIEAYLNAQLESELSIQPSQRPLHVVAGVKQSVRFRP